MSIDKRTIKSYNSFAKKWAKRMRSGKNSAHDFLEKPAMENLLPPLNGLSVLCVGCGSGEECGYLKSMGAAEVVGVDAAEKLLEIASDSYPEIEFIHSDIENLDLDRERFDLVYSSLVMHYMEDWKAALTNIYRMLKPGGQFIFSTHHPLLNSAEFIQEPGKSARLLGVSRENGKLKEIFGDYYTGRLIEDVWFEGEFEVNYYHRSLEDIMADILASGFTIAGFYEPRATEAARTSDPDFFRAFTKIPLFMIFKLVK